MKRFSHEGLDGQQMVKRQRQEGEMTMPQNPSPVFGFVNNVQPQQNTLGSSSSNSVSVPVLTCETSNPNLLSQQEPRKMQVFQGGSNAEMCGNFNARQPVCDDGIMRSNAPCLMNMRLYDII